jgi:tRNA-dihydrouridine synthase
MNSSVYHFGIKVCPGIDREVFDMTDHFWRDLPRPFFILAPMEDVTDVVFRHVVSEAARPDVFFTEFANTESYCHPEGNHSVRGRLTFTEDEQPIVAHIWGDKPEYFRQMSIGMAKEGFKGIDINMGCPVANVAENGKGSGLICRPELAADIIQAAKAGGLPVSVKTRLGFSAVDEWREMSKVEAHWELIPEIKKLRDEVAPDTLLTINGDIPDRQTGLQLAEQYGVDGIMIGRGIFHNPFAFEKEPKEHSSEELLDLLRLHLDLHDQYSALEQRSFRPLSRFFKIYVRGFRGASELRNSLMNAKSTSEVRALLNEFGSKEHSAMEEHGN